MGAECLLVSDASRLTDQAIYVAGGLLFASALTGFWP
jgi:hypothetical protein